MKSLKFAPFLLFACIIFLVFKNWFSSSTITGGDLWYFFPSMYSNHSLVPQGWVFFAGNGFGGSGIPFMAVNFFLGIPFFFGKTFGISWEVLVRLFLLYPFLICVNLFPYLLFRKLFQNEIFAVLSALIFSLNTYILMLISGGLVVIGISYSLIPLVFLLVVKILEEKKSRLDLSLLLGFILGIQSVLDVRVTYITFVGIILFLLARFIHKRSFFSLKNLVLTIILPTFTAVILNAFWVVPSILYGANALEELGDNYTTIESVRFFSFAKFENSISLLHPNWPENIFGKTYFLRPEFLLLPVLAFSSLFFVNNKNRIIIAPIVIISLVSIFLAKGSNDPFGFIYLFLFENVPGFVFYRDPTKWYMLTAFSFAVLIPFTLLAISKTFKKIGYLVLPLFVLYFLLTIYPAFSGNLPGTFQKNELPKEYIRFEEFMTNQLHARVLWIPSPSRFSYFSEKHPAVAANRYYKENLASDISKLLSESLVLDDLANNSVRYVAVPFDSNREIFIINGEYSENEYIETYRNLDQNASLSSVGSFGKLKLYELRNNNGESNLLYSSDYKKEEPSFILGSIISLLGLAGLVVAIVIIKKYES